MIRQLLAIYQRSRHSRTLQKCVRLGVLPLEARLTPTGADMPPASIAAPAIVTIAPQPLNVAPSLNASPATAVRTDLFGHGSPTSDETDPIWLDWCGDDTTA